MELPELYRGHDAEYWHGRYVHLLNVYLTTLLDLFDKDPVFKTDVLFSLDQSKPGWRESLSDFLNKRPRPQSVDFVEDV